MPLQILTRLAKYGYPLLVMITVEYYLIEIKKEYMTNPFYKSIVEKILQTPESTLKTEGNLLKNIGEAVNPIKEEMTIYEGVMRQVKDSLTDNTSYIFKFLPWNSFSEFISEYYKFLDLLSTPQKGALIHILINISILFCLFNLIGVFYGDKLIGFFNLEEKYPKLSFYFKLRRKYQQYYFLWNSLLIFFNLLIIISLDIYVFIIT